MGSSIFSKAWAVMILLLVVVQAVFLGEDLGTKDGKGAVVDGILLAFWVFALVWFHFQALREQKLDMELERSTKNLDKAMEDLMGHIKKDIDHKHKIEKGLHDANKAVAGDRPPKPSEFKKVEEKFHELTGLYLKLVAEKGDKRPGAEVSDEPFVKSTAKKKAPAKKGATNVKPKARK